MAIRQQTCKEIMTPQWHCNECTTLSGGVVAFAQDLNGHVGLRTAAGNGAMPLSLVPTGSGLARLPLPPFCERSCKLGILGSLCLHLFLFVIETVTIFMG